MELIYGLIGLIASALGFLIWNKPKLGTKVVWYCVLGLLCLVIGFQSFDEGYNRGIADSITIFSTKIVSTDSLSRDKQIIKLHELRNSVEEDFKVHKDSFDKYKFTLLICGIICGGLLTFARVRKNYNRQRN